MEFLYLFSLYLEESKDFMSLETHEGKLLDKNHKLFIMGG